MEQIVNQSNITPLNQCPTFQKDVYKASVATHVLRPKLYPFHFFVTLCVLFILSPSSSILGQFFVDISMIQFISLIVLLIQPLKIFYYFAATHFSLLITPDKIVITQGHIVRRTTHIKRGQLLHYKVSQNVFLNYMCCSDISLYMRGNGNAAIKLFSLDNDDKDRIISALFGDSNHV